MARATYRAASGAFDAANGTGAFFSISGVANKTVILHRIYLEGPTMVTPGFLNVLVKRTSTAPTGGTATTLTNVPTNTASIAGEATVKVYTAAPTSGTVIGNLSAHRIYSHKTSPVADGICAGIEVFQAQDVEDRIVLRSAAEAVQVHFETAPGGVVTLMMRLEWEEE